MDNQRLSLENSEMRKRFPSFTLVNLTNGQLGWQGVVSTRYGNAYAVIVAYPPDYPYSAPKIYSSDLVSNTPHRYKDGSICTHIPAEWNSNCTVVTAIGWGAAWFHAYDTWRMTGGWPGRQHVQ